MGKAPPQTMSDAIISATERGGYATVRSNPKNLLGDSPFNRRLNSNPMNSALRFTLDDIKEEEAKVSIAEALVDTKPKKARRILRGVKEKLANQSTTFNPNADWYPKIGRDLKDELAVQLMVWRRDGLFLQKARNSVKHRIEEAYSKGKVVALFAGKAIIEERLSLAGIHSFVIEHNWAGAFERATDYASGEFKLPYNGVCFEFFISGRHACAIMLERDNRPYHFLPLVEVKDYWVIPQYMYVDEGDGWKPTQKFSKPQEDYFGGLKDLMLTQIRAISIALEAEVATTEVVRAPHRLNHQREKRGVPPIADYHVIKLARRTRPASLPDPSADERNHPRCHFVRGHWRHFSNHKTWIKWYLRGDPDLGFIDKEYRL